MEEATTKDINKEIISENFRKIMEDGLGLNMNDPNFLDTPERVAKSYAELFAGLNHAREDLEEIFKKCFPTSYKGIVLEKDIIVFSMCPHHFLPIKYEVTIGYIPNGKAIGLSKLARIIELLSKMPCLQETFTEKIVDEIDKHISPLGVMCIVKGAHYCMQMRGVKQKDVWTTTSSATGVFLNKQEMELKFYELVKNS